MGVLFPGFSGDFSLLEGNTPISLLEGARGARTPGTKRLPFCLRIWLWVKTYGIPPILGPIFVGLGLFPGGTIWILTHGHIRGNRIERHQNRGKTAETWLGPTENGAQQGGSTVIPPGSLLGSPASLFGLNF